MATLTSGPARGFTLLELLVVMVLAGILLSVLTVTVTPDPRQQLARDAQRVGQLFALAADEVRIRQQPIFWEADLRGYRFVTLVGAERRLVTGDDLLRERAWDRPLQMLALYDAGAAEPAQQLLGTGAAPLRLPIAREWVQSRRRLELATDAARVTIDFDERGRASIEPR